MYRVSGGENNPEKWHFMTSCGSESDYMQILRAAGADLRLFVLYLPGVSTAAKSMTRDCI